MQILRKRMFDTLNKMARGIGNYYFLQPTIEIGTF